SVTANDRLIIFPHYMQNHLFVSSIVTMVMIHPTGCSNVNFHTSTPSQGINFNSCITEIRACMCISDARMKHLHQLTRSGFQLPFVEVLKLPEVVKEGFGHGILDYDLSTSAS